MEDVYDSYDDSKSENVGISYGKSIEERHPFRPPVS